MNKHAEMGMEKSGALDEFKSGPADIAIVGCGLRLPGGASSLDELWEFLVAGGDGIRDVPDGRWLVDLYDPHARAGFTYVKRAGWIDGHELIDTSFLGCTPREAGQIDPQQRLLVETAFEAIEMSGIPLERLQKTRTGVFIGISSNDYAQRTNEDNRKGNAYTNTGGAFSIAANRVSYLYDLRGPSLAIDTACASGLTALDMAVRSITQGASEQAIVGAVNAMFRAEPFAGFCAASMLSPVGQCRAFDADGKGFVRAEGAVSYLLKPLAAALRDRDPILAVIKGTDSNNDGRTGGISLPNTEAQQELIERVFRQHDISYDNIVYVEAHGTGTAAGDPIEAGAIGRGIAQKRSGDSPTLIGSIKSNIGHLEPASGLAGMAKSILALNHRQVPRSLHFDTPNPDIDFEGLRVKVVEETTDLPATDGPAMIGINSFGFGGSNAHVVLAEPPAREPVPAPEMPRPWAMVSARSPEALQKTAADLVDWMDGPGKDVPLTTICGNLLTRRSWHPHRAALFADNRPGLRGALSAIAAEQESDRTANGLALADAKTAFVFTGNGPQWWAMGQQLYREAATFRETLDEIDAMFRKVADLPLVEEMLKSEEDSKMALTEIAQPALFGLQVGLVKLFAEDGLVADATVGHSAGELAAAYCAGGFDLETIVRIVAARSHEQGKTKGHGAMAAIGYSVADAETILTRYEGLVIAGDNGPDAVSVAGPIASIDRLVEDLKEQGAFATKLRLDYAFHSPVMDPIEADFRKSVAGIVGSKNKIPFYSTVTGTALDGTDLDIEYWWRNLRDPVMFHPAVKQMCEDGYGVFVEVGPHPNLVGYVKGVARAVSRNVRTVETLRRNTGEMQRRRLAVCSAAAAGAKFDFSEVFPEPVEALKLPSYPWQRERHFVDLLPRPPMRALESQHEFLGAKTTSNENLWVKDIALSRMPYVGDHKIRGTVLFPAAGFFETALAAGKSLGLEGTLELRHVRIEKACALDSEREVTLQTTYDATDHSLSIASRTIKPDANAEEEAEPFTEHMRGVLEVRPQADRTLDLAEIRGRMTDGARPDTEHYALCNGRGLNYGPAFQTVSRIERGKGEVLAELIRKDQKGSEFILDPMQVDGALQAMIGLIDAGDDRRLFIPVQMDRMILRGSTEEHDVLYAHVVKRGANRFYLSADVTLIAADGMVLAEFFGLQVRSVGSSTGAGALEYTHRMKAIQLFDERLPEIAPASLLDPEPKSERARRRRAMVGVHDRMTDKLCASFTAATFYDLTGGAPADVSALIEEGKVIPEHERYARAILADAVKEGYARELSPGVFEIPERPDGFKLWYDAQREAPSYSAEAVVFGRVYQKLPELLRGEASPLEIMFPRSGSPLMEQMYDQGFASLEANETLADVIRRFADTLPENRPLRILEVGGGTGGTTGHVLSSIDPERVDYLFTDVGPDFLSRIERRFGNLPRFRTAMLDITKPASVEEIGGPFDIIIGANVVHATPSLRQTLGVLHDLLRENGMIALSEVQRYGSFDFLFGLLPGVWLYSDPEDRPDHALLNGDAWVKILTEVGFADVALLTDETDTAPARSSALIGRKPVAQASDADAETPPAKIEGTWLLLAPADGPEIANRFAEKLAAHGVTALTKLYAQTPEGAGGEVMDGTDETAWAAFCAETAAQAPDRIVFVAPCMSPTDEPEPDAGWPLAAFLKSAQANWSGTAPRLEVLAQNVLASKDINAVGGCYWAVGRVAVNELPGWTTLRIDLDGSDTAFDAAFDWMTGLGRYNIPENADEIRFTAEGIWLNTMISALKGEAADADSEFAVTLPILGSIDALMLREAPKTDDPAPGMVEVEIRAAGLNFKDIILALGMLPPELLKDSEVGPLMGLEGAGIVTKVGEGVSRIKVGDHVMMMAEGCFASKVMVSEFAVHPIPTGWSFDDAATIPVVGLTVVYALDIIARLQPGETILVHGGAGGVGLMTIQYAKSIGAKVIATAGSDEKRDLMELLGVDFISNSRTLEFEEEVRAFTNGEGVDVVLNSLAGDAMLATLDLIKPFGRFVEIGKRDFEANNRLNMRALENNVSYFAVDLTYLPQKRPELFLEAWKRLLAGCESGDFRPLQYRSYPMASVKEAFRVMQAGRHIGKIVLSLDGPTPARVPLQTTGLTFASDGVHLITGGLGGIGLKLSKWMAERGARTIALVGRSGVKTDEQIEGIKAIEAAGAKVVVMQADVSDKDEVARVLAEVKAHGPLRGIIHAVLVLDDMAMSNMARENFLKPAQPKISGAHYLDQMTRGEPVDYFLVFSSAANLIGNPGQANYVAGNAYNEQIIAARQAEGLPGLSLALGAVADAGILERDHARRDLVIKQLGGAVNMADLFEALERHLLDNETKEVTLVDAGGKFNFPILKSARTAVISFMAESKQDGAAEKVDFNAVPAEERAALMESVVIQTLAKVMGAKESRIDPERTLTEAGLDSLMAVEFGMALEQRLGASIPTAELSKDRSLRDLGLLLLDRMGIETGEKKATAGDGALGETELNPEEQLMMADAELPEGYAVTTPAPEVPIAERNAVLLTGATGFMGGFLLDEILRRGAKRVICIGRGRDRSHAEARIASALANAGLNDAARQIGGRVEVWPGDLKAEGFGLDDSQIKEIVDEVDLIVHNGADVNFVSDYEDMRAANVLSVRQFIELCAQGRPKVFHFVSTLRIFVRLDQIESQTISEEVEAWLPPSDEGGYVKTKWVADKLVRAAREAGLVAGIYRPSFVMGRSSDGFSNVSDLGSALAQFAIDTNILPKVKVNMAIIPVDTAARWISAFIDLPGEQAGIRHITDWPGLSMPDIQKIVEGEGVPAELKEMDEFLDIAGAFFDKNPGHPALWLPTFFSTDAANNTLASKLTNPVLPSTEVMNLEEGHRVLGLMVRWFKDRRREQAAAKSPEGAPAAE